MAWLNYILQFLISGAVVVGASIISQNWDSKWSGLIVALPIMTILGFIFISLNTNQEIAQRYLLSALLFMIPAATYILSLYLLYNKTSLVQNIFLSSMPLIIAVFLIQKFI